MKEKHQIVEVCVKEVDKHWLRRGGILVEKNKQITDNILKKINIITDSKDSDENLINIIYTIKKETKKNCRFSERFTMWWGFCYIRDYIIQNNIETRDEYEHEYTMYGDDGEFQKFNSFNEVQKHEYVSSIIKKQFTNISIVAYL